MLSPSEQANPSPLTLPKQPQIYVCLLGHPRCFVLGVEVDLAAKTMLLLAYMSTYPQKAITRAKLCDLLWGNQTDRNAKHSLSQALYNLRRAVQPLEITATPQLVTLNSLIRTDVSDLLSALEGKQWKVLSNLCNSRFLESDSVNFTTQYSHWRDGQAAQLGSILDRALVRSFEAEFSASNWTECSSIADVLEQLGDTQSDLCNKIETVRAMSLHPLPAGGRSKISAPKFVGRARELAELNAQREATEDGSTTLCSIRGESGIGKSRLGNHFAKWTSLRGDAVLHARCYEAERFVPFATTAQLLEQVPSKAMGSMPQDIRIALALLHPSFSTNELELSGVQPAPTKIYLFQAVTEAFIKFSNGRRLLLWIDDIQWCDDATLEWLHYFSRIERNEGCMFLVAQRLDRGVGMPETNIWIGTHPATKYFDLDALAESDAEDLLETYLVQCGIETTPKDRRYIREKCGGHPLFLVAIANSLAEGDRTILAGTDFSNAVPEAIQRLVLRRIETLSPPARAVAETLACLPVGVETLALAEFTALTQPSIRTAIIELDEARLLKRSELSLAHEMVRRSVYQSMSLVARRLRHEQIYRCMKHEHSAAARADQAVRAGLRQEAHDESIVAANQASSVYAYTEALHHFATAANAAVLEEAQARALIGLTNLLFDLKRYHDAVPYLERIEKWAERTDDSDAQLLCGVVKVGTHIALGTRQATLLDTDVRLLVARASRLGSPHRLVQTLRTAILVAQHISKSDDMLRLLSHVERVSAKLSPAAQAEILATIGMNMAVLNEERAIDLSERAIRIARDVGEPRLLVNALGAKGAIYTVSGKPDLALQYLAQAEEALTDPALSDILANVHANRACIYFDQGQYQLARQENAFALSSGSAMQLWPMLNEAVAYLECDDAKTSIMWANKALQANSTLNVPWIEIIARTIIGSAFLLDNDVRSAEAECAVITKLLPSASGLMTDLSYTYIFLSDIDALHNDIVSARVRLESALRSTTSAFVRCRLQVALARIITEIEPDLSYHLAHTAHLQAVSLDSPLLAAKAKRVLACCG